ncbi:MAG: hypothetical protein K2K53_09615, partial [Oscillospiraceae bacterium]|nr:hypothetical protein [Oscillospiraceae bacterium]
PPQFFFNYTESNDIYTMILVGSVRCVYQTAHCGGLDVGDKLRLEGRLQSRQYHKLVDGEQVERTAFEISVMNLLDSAEPS